MRITCIKCTSPNGRKGVYSPCVSRSVFFILYFARLSLLLQPETSLHKLPMAGIYIHVPFCESRCAYCDFYSTTLLRHRETYIDTVCRELKQRLPSLGDEAIETVYLGGGTPSTLTTEEVGRIMEAIGHNAQPKELTLEANPDDLTEEYVQALRTLPINRVSIGIQSFHDRTLRLVGRRHTAQEAIEAVHRCQRLGLTNISIDLMYGLPGVLEVSPWYGDGSTAPVEVVVIGHEEVGHRARHVAVLSLRVEGIHHHLAQQQFDVKVIR